MPGAFQTSLSTYTTGLNVSLVQLTFGVASDTFAQGRCRPYNVPPALRSDCLMESW